MNGVHGMYSSSMLAVQRLVLVTVVLHGQIQASDEMNDHGRIEKHVGNRSPLKNILQYLCSPTTELNCRNTEAMRVYEDFSDTQLSTISFHFSHILFPLCFNPFSLFTFIQQHWFIVTSNDLHLGNHNEQQIKPT